MLTVLGGLIQHLGMCLCAVSCTHNDNRYKPNHRQQNAVSNQENCLKRGY